MDMRMRREKSRKYSERDVAASIEEEIVGNEMVPGIRLPSASQIAKQYAVSLKTADRALCRLAAKGLISRVRGSGRTGWQRRDFVSHLCTGSVLTAFPS